MRRAKGPRSNQAVLLGQPDYAMDLCTLEGFFEFQRRKNGGHALGEHRFARARRTDEQDVMAAGSSYFDGALRMRLAAHFAKVIRVVIKVRQQRLGVNLQRQGRLLAVEQFDYAFERS